MAMSRAQPRKSAKQDASAQSASPPVVLLSLRLFEAHRTALMLEAAKQTGLRGKRVSVNTLILEAIEKTYGLPTKPA